MRTAVIRNIISPGIDLIVTAAPGVDHESARIADTEEADPEIGIIDATRADTDVNLLYNLKKNMSE